MSIEDDQTKWRMVFCKDPTFMLVTTYPEPDQPHTVVQPDAAALLCTNTPSERAPQEIIQEVAASLKMTNTPDGVTAQEVRQADPAELKCTNTPDGVTVQEVTQLDAAQLKVTNSPDGETSQPVHQGGAIQGIWPAAGSLRVNVTGFVNDTVKKVIYTVPANKKLFISGSMLTSSEAVDTVSRIKMIVENAAQVLKYILQIHYYAKAGQQISYEHNLPALEATALDRVSVQSINANIVGSGKFQGWLEDA